MIKKYTFTTSPVIDLKHYCLNLDVLSMDLNISQFHVSVLVHRYRNVNNQSDKYKCGVTDWLAPWYTVKGSPEMSPNQPHTLATSLSISLSQHQQGRHRLLGDRFQSHQGILRLTVREGPDDLFPAFSLVQSKLNLMHFSTGSARWGEL